MWNFAFIVLSCSTIYWPDHVEAQLNRIGPIFQADFGSGEGEKLDPAFGSGTGEFHAPVIPPSCTSEFHAQVDHTMCLWDDHRVRITGISAIEQSSILGLHNSLRAQVHPSAIDLTMLTWDENLAAVADKWAKQCVIGHDGNRRIPHYGMFIGQNVAAGHRSWQDAIMSWYTEVELYQYGLDPSTYLGNNGWKKIGHYTQMVQNDTYRIGCGFAMCTGTPYGRYYVCNYAKGQSRLSFPYTEGRQCSSCPNTCWKGLCDCEGLLCLNQGRLDPDTCTCSCPTIYSGFNCSTLNCPAKDPFYCGHDLVMDDCSVYANVPHLCPYMCGICGTSPDTMPTTPKPVKEEEPFISPFNCTYRGVRGDKEACRTYGEKGMDKIFCASEGGQFTCDDCSVYYNVKRDYCPVMCGLCDAPCGGKTCLNGGKLNPDTCLCNCTTLYDGEMCERLNCPPHEKWHCNIMPENFCKVYKNIPADCPYTCGLCLRKNETVPATV